MADEMIDLSPGAGDGGLDDTAADEPEGGEVTPQGVVEPEEPDDTDEPSEEQGDDWTSGLDDETREAIGTKYRSPADLAKAYVEAEKRLGSQGHEIGEMRQTLAEVLQQIQEDGGGQGGNGNGEAQQLPDYSEVSRMTSELMRQVDDGEVDPGKAIAAVIDAMGQVAALREQAIVGALQQQMAEHTAPLEGFRHNTELAREVQSVKKQLGEERYNEFAQAAADRLDEWTKMDPSYTRNPRSVRTAFNEVIAESWMRGQRESEASVLERSGRGPSGRGVSPAKAVLAEMDEISAPQREFGGGL